MLEAKAAPRKSTTGLPVFEAHYESDHRTIEISITGLTPEQLDVVADTFKHLQPKRRPSHFVRHEFIAHFTTEAEEERFKETLKEQGIDNKQVTADKLHVKLASLTDEQFGKIQSFFKENFSKERSSTHSEGFFHAHVEKGKDALLFLQALELQEKEVQAGTPDLSKLLEAKKAGQELGEEDVSKFLEALQTKTIVVPNMKFDQPNKTRDQILSAENKRFAATCMGFDAKGDKDGVSVTLKRTPQDIVAKLMPILSHLPHVGDMNIGHNHTVTVEFATGDDAKGFYQAIRHAMAFSEGEHVINHKIDSAVKKHLELNKQRA